MFVFENRIANMSISPRFHTNNKFVISFSSFGGMVGTVI